MKQYPETDLTDLFFNELKLHDVSFDYTRTYNTEVYYQGKMYPVKTAKMKQPWNPETGPSKSDAEAFERYQFYNIIMKGLVMECDIRFAGGAVAILKVIGPNTIFEPEDFFCPRHGLMMRYAWMKHGTEKDRMKVYKKYGIE